MGRRLDQASAWHRRRRPGLRAVSYRRPRRAALSAAAVRRARPGEQSVLGDRIHLRVARLTLCDPVHHFRVALGYGLNVGHRAAGQARTRHGCAHQRLHPRPRPDALRSDCAGCRASPSTAGLPSRWRPPIRRWEQRPVAARQGHTMTGVVQPRRSVALDPPSQPPGVLLDGLGTDVLEVCGAVFGHPAAVEKPFFERPCIHPRPLRLWQRRVGLIPDDQRTIERRSIPRSERGLYGRGCGRHSRSGQDESECRE